MIFQLAMFLAENDPPRLDVQTVYVMGGILSLLGIYVLVMKAISVTRENFGRRPTIEVDLQAKADVKDLDHVKVSMKGFATTGDLEAVQKEHHLRARGLEEQISGLRHDLKGESEARVITSRDTLEQFGELREQIADVNKQGETRSSAVHERINVVAVGLGEIRGEIKHMTAALRDAVMVTQNASKQRGGG